MAIYEPNEKQKRELNRMLFQALVELRNLGWAGKAEQAGDLADAFHGLPVHMYSPDFDWEFFREAFLRAYQDKYQRSSANGYDYIAMLDEIEKLRT